MPRSILSKNLRRYNCSHCGELRLFCPCVDLEGQALYKESDLSLSELSEVCGPTYLHPKPPGGHYFPVWTPHDRRRKAAAVKDDGSDDAGDGASDGPTPTAPRTRRA